MIKKIYRCAAIINFFSCFLCLKCVLNFEKYFQLTPLLISYHKEMLLDKILGPFLILRFFVWEERSLIAVLLRWEKFWTQSYCLHWDCRWSDEMRSYKGVFLSLRWLWLLSLRNPSEFTSLNSRGMYFIQLLNSFITKINNSLIYSYTCIIYISSLIVTNWNNRICQKYRLNWYRIIKVLIMQCNSLGFL